jgi:hypothetical protein
MSEHSGSLGRERQDEALGVTALTSREVPEEVTSWLGRLALLYGVPFEHLVPDATMLPPESIRFFHLDANWTEAMVDGAFSVGAHSQRDIRFHRLLQPAVLEATALAAGTVRRDLRGEGSAPGGPRPVGDSATDDRRVRAGFLMRSEIVAGWPGLEVAGYAGSDTTGDVVPILRLDRLAPDLLLCVFAEVPALVVIGEPGEGLHFGIGDLTEAETAGAVDAAGRVDLAALVTTFNRGRAGTPVDTWSGDGRPFGPGDFAAIMVDSAGQQRFDARVLDAGAEVPPDDEVDP